MFSIVGKEIFRTQYGLDGDQLQLAGALSMIPWDFKLVYGIICDTVIIPKFEESPKRGYMIIWGTIQVAALLIIATFVFETYKPMMYLLFVVSISGAFMDVVVDGIMTVQ